MDRLIEFSRRSTIQLKKILTFYDKRNGSDLYSKRLLKALLDELQHLAKYPTIGNPSTRPDVRFVYLMGYTIIYRYSPQKVTLLSIRSDTQKPLKMYVKK
jgi:plasmid stabilization system protein ParE